MTATGSGTRLDEYLGRHRAAVEAALAEMQLGVAHYVRNGQRHKAALDGAAEG